MGQVKDLRKREVELVKEARKAQERGDFAEAQRRRQAAVAHEVEALRIEREEKRRKGRLFTPQQLNQQPPGIRAAERQRRGVYVGDR